jgi:hypothetical protein
VAARECYHCKQLIGEGEPHDCWTTTEAALTAELSDDLRDAWERLRETAAELGEQRIYASHNSIMFARKACHFFVRPKKNFLELCVFLGRTVRSPLIVRSDPSSRTKVYHLIQIRHRDQVEAPLTDWLREAYELQDELAATRAPVKRATKKAAKKKVTKKKAATKKTARTRR